MGRSWFRDGELRYVDQRELKDTRLPADEAAVADEFAGLGPTQLRFPVLIWATVDRELQGRQVSVD